MTLPAPGNPISANQINVEGDRSGTANAPLSGSSSTPQAGSLVKLYAPPNSDVNQSAPHAYSEFYSKTWNALTSYSSSTGTTFSGVCALSIDQTYYHNGSGTYPAAGDTVYSDSGGTSVLADFYYKFNSTYVIRITGGAGVVNASWPQDIC